MTTEEFGDTTLRRLGHDEPGTWLASYERALASTSMGEVSRGVVLGDSRLIAENAVLVIGDDGWDGSRVRTGVVVGAVQSGKTASMIGVLATALDRGVNVAVVLAGTRTALWQQTMRRIRAQLEIDSGRAPRRIFLPSVGAEARPRPAEAYVLARPSVARALRSGQPLIAVVLKQVDHLSHLARALHRVVFPAAADVGVPINLLVIDDEADDSSIEGDASAPADAGMKQVPRRILDLWESRRHPGVTVAEHVYATYLAYTATPQANFLQDDANPLFPRDFGAVLRTPGPEGDPAERALTYRVPEGIQGWYTGADLYYHQLRDSLCVSLQESGPSELPKVQVHSSPGTDPAGSQFAPVIDAVRAYLVAAAVRLSRAHGRIGPYQARSTTFDSHEAASEALCPVTSMLVHPSAAMETHFDVADALKTWWGGPGAEGVRSDIEEHEDSWQRWRHSYAESARAVAEKLEKSGPAVERSVPDWSDLRALIIAQVAPGTRIEVINSDPNADDRPEFEPVQAADGSWLAPPNLSTIFVAGNVMSRGLTIEGLLTTIFTRTANVPLADTQMQMQRWFGYRGEYLDLCRVFASDEQLDLFTDYSDTDHVLRVQLLQQMRDAGGPWLDMSVLHGAQYRATGKIANLGSRELSPGFSPFFRHVNPPGYNDPNLEIVCDVLLTARTRGALREEKEGLLIVEPWDLRETAELLERLRFIRHGFHEDDSRFWQGVAQQADIPADDPDLPLYRAPNVSEPSEYRGTTSPYYVAAYLRFWAACLTRNVRGLMTTDQPAQRWALLEPAYRRSRQPHFCIGLRFGSGDPIETAPLRDLADALGVPVRPMVRTFGNDSSYLAAGWGSRKRLADGYTGDDMFDFRVLGERPTTVRDRVRASGRGLVLFQLVRRTDGTAGVAVGLSIPAGGPDHTEAVNPGRR